MTSLDPIPSAPAPQASSQVASLLRAGLGQRLSGRWQRPALVLAGGLVLSDALGQVLHLNGGMAGVAALAGGWWLLVKRRPTPTPRLPTNHQAWLERCRQLISQFERLEGEQGQARHLSRTHELAQLEVGPAPRPLDLALAGCQLPRAELQAPMAAALRHQSDLRLCWGEPLPAQISSWSWPEGLQACDAVLYHLPLPLLAVDLRWLEALPNGQPLWLLVSGMTGEDAAAALAPLLSQRPAEFSARVLPWDGERGSLQASLEPLARWLDREATALRQATPLRRLEALHGRWQADLEGLRRAEWRQLLQRSQWLVAAGVAAAPLPSLDLVVMAAANALMLQEMARIWDCPWSAEQLRAVAVELGQACLGLGLVEWSSQALLTALRLDGTAWLVGTALQGLAAAYLTRVVSHAMADYLALSSGVAAPDLEAVKRQAPMLVSKAAEAERLDWTGFLQQARGWLQTPPSPAHS